MPIETTEGGTIITGEHIYLAQMIAQKGALKLELLGMRRRGRSVYSIVKKMYNLRGTKERVYEQFCELVEKRKKELTNAK